TRSTTSGDQRRPPLTECNPTGSAFWAVGDHFGDRMRDARMLRAGRDDEDIPADGGTAVVSGRELRVPERAAVSGREGDDATVVGGNDDGIASDCRTAERGRAELPLPD